jgi:hypothetical protein
MRREHLTETTRRVTTHPRVDARRERAGCEVEALAEVARLAGLALALDASRSARQPRVEDHPLPDLESLG